MKIPAASMDTAWRRNVLRYVSSLTFQKIVVDARIDSAGLVDHDELVESGVYEQYEQVPAVRGDDPCSMSIAKSRWLHPRQRDRYGRSSSKGSARWIN